MTKNSIGLRKDIELSVGELFAVKTAELVIPRVKSISVVMQIIF